MGLARYGTTTSGQPPEQGGRTQQDQDNLEPADPRLLCLKGIVDGLGVRDGVRPYP